MTARLQWAAAATLAVAAFCYLWQLGGYPLLDPDEGRYGEIAREMLESGDFVTPRLNYVKYLEKPPLLYWLTAGALAVGGEREVAARAVPAAAAFLTVLATMSLGRRMFGATVGVLAAWIYVTTVLGLAMARLLIIDGLFSLCLTGAWGAWWLGYAAERPGTRRWWHTVAWACLGLAVMAKGPTALVLSALLVGGFVAWRRDPRALVDMGWWPGLPVFLAIVAPWFWLVSVRNPEFAHFFIVVQHLQRFEGREHIRPVWFYLPVIVGGLGVWGVALLPALVDGLRWLLHGSGARTVSRRGSERAATQFLVVWALVVTAFFSASGCKLVPYVLPAFPALALLLARWFHCGGLERPAVRWTAAVTGAVLLATATAAPALVARQNAAHFAALAPATVALMVALVAGGGFLLVSVRHPRLFPAAAGVWLVLAVPGLVLCVETMARYRRTPELLAAMPQPLPAQVRVAELGTYDQSISFYLRRRVTLIDELDELAFGSTIGDQSEFFRQGEESLEQLSSRGPLLVNILPEEWPRISQAGFLKVAAANTRNVLVGNDPFFRITGLRPWPDEAVHEPPLLLWPQRVN